MKKKTPKDYLREAIDLAGGPTALAERIGGNTRHAHVWNWMNRDERLPADYVIPVCRSVGYAVIPHQLRPDLYPNESDGIIKQPAA